ncbi:hydrolase [Pacificimonas flava]|uniref:Hydrolase n=2 Tax=Pacificimonas TaxID=1960290 RepID=A0A219B230_9SPHN|nr:MULTISPECIES: HAD family phosphatase [Pacificimonas]MBZ6377976.1 HAD family phosphatase [Pacificimonas aurantium]OWV32375.1 hydrolase [Pacificimonas flava]
MPSPQLETVIFDVGHVLYDWDIRYLYAKLIPDPDRLEWFLTNVVTRQWHFQHDARRPFVETKAELIAQYPAEAELISLYGPRWLETIGEPVPGMTELVETLAKAGYRIFGITNFSAEFWAMFRPTAPVFDLFEDIIVSGEEKMMKPDPAIYALAESRFGIDPSQALFIDDQPKNVAAARDAGFNAVEFTGRPAVEEELAKLGVQV